MKEHTIHIRVSDRDLKQLDDTAERLGLSRSDLLRRCLSGNVLIKAAELELTRLLTREIVINGVEAARRISPKSWLSTSESFARSIRVWLLRQIPA